MINGFLLPFTGLLVLQVELQIFTNNLLNGVAQRSVAIFHTNDTSDLVNSVLTSAAMVQHTFKVINVQADSINYLEPTIFTTDSLVFFILGHDFEFGYRYQLLSALFSAMVITPNLKMFWMFLDRFSQTESATFLNEMHEFFHWHDSVVVQLTPLEPICVMRLEPFDKNVVFIDYKNNQFTVPGVMYKALFVESYTNFNGRPFQVFGELEVPKVAFERKSSDTQKFVVGSDVSMAIMIGRYLNASVYWHSYVKRDVSEILSNKEYAAFVQFVEPTYNLGDSVVDKLPWQYGSFETKYMFFFII